MHTVVLTLRLSVDSSRSSIPTTNTAIFHHLAVTIPNSHTLSEWHHRNTHTNLQESVLFHSPNPPLHNISFCCTGMKGSYKKTPTMGSTIVGRLHDSGITALYSAVKTAEAWSHTHTNYRDLPPFHLHAFKVHFLDRASNSPLPLRIYKCYITNVITLPNWLSLAFVTTTRIVSIWCPVRPKHTASTTLSAVKLTSLLSVLHTIATFPSLGPLARP